MSVLCITCVTDKSLCDKCKDNPKYADYPRRSFYKEYEPTCPQGFDDCVYDPAYIKHYCPDWYKDLYDDLTPEEASRLHCNIDDEYCYDDEDK